MAEVKGDLYVPRKCSATNRVITAKDHSSVQINIGRVNPSGVYTGEYDTIALCGFIRANSRADESVNRLAAELGHMKDLRSFATHHAYDSKKE